MMIVEILLAVFVILSVLIVIKFLHQIVKALFLIGALLSVMIIIFGVFVFLDAKDLKDHITTSPSRIAYTSGGNILVLLDLDPTKLNVQRPNSDLPEGITVFTKQQMGTMSLTDLTGLRGNAYKLFIFDDAYFDTLSISTISFQGSEVPASTVRNLMRSPDPIIAYLRDIKGVADPKVQEATKQQMLVVDPNSEQNIRGIAFLLYFSESMKPANLPSLFTGVRSGTVQIEPQTAIVEAFKITPAGLVRFAVDKVISQGQNALDQVKAQAEQQKTQDQPQTQGTAAP